MIQKRKLATMSVTVLTIAALLAGCGANQSATKAPVAVNTYKVVAADTPVKAEYSGTVTATDKVPVRPKIFRPCRRKIRPRRSGSHGRAAVVPPRQPDL